MHKTLTLAMAPGDTRDCLDPWGYIQVKANGDIQPCCAHPSIGALTPENSLDEILNDFPIRNLRNGILSGDLNAYCRMCGIKAPVSLFEFRRHFARHMALMHDHQMRDGWATFEHFAEGDYAISDAITLKPGPRGSAGRVIFNQVDWGVDRVFDTIAEWRGDAGVIVTVSAGASADTLQPVISVEIAPQATMQIFAELPADPSRGVIALSAQSAAADSGENASLTLTFPLLRPAAGTLATTQLVSFANGGGHQYIESGMSFPEPTGVWTCGPRATLNIPIPESQASPRFIEIRASGFVAPQNRVRKAVVTINGGAPTPLTFYAEVGAIDFLIPLPESTGSAARVEFTILNPISPHVLGQSEDIRDLGLFLHQIQFCA